MVAKHPIYNSANLTGKSVHHKDFYISHWKDINFAIIPEGYWCNVSLFYRSKRPPSGKEPVPGRDFDTTLARLPGIVGNGTCKKLPAFRSVWLGITSLLYILLVVIPELKLLKNMPSTCYVLRNIYWCTYHCMYGNIYIYNIHCIPQEHGYNPVFTNISFLRALRLRQGTVTSQRRSESLRDNLSRKAHKQVKVFEKLEKVWEITNMSVVE